MKINRLKYKILLDNNLDSVTNKISNYKKYGFKDSDLVEILFVLTDEILKNDYIIFCQNLKYDVFKIIQNELIKSLNNNTLNFEDKIFCLMWLNIFNTFKHIEQNYFDYIERISKLEYNIKNLNEQILLLVHK